MGGGRARSGKRSTEFMVEDLGDKYTSLARREHLLQPRLPPLADDPLPVTIYCMLASSALVSSPISLVPSLRFSRGEGGKTEPGCHCLRMCRFSAIVAQRAAGAS